jgi:rhodanese-related sulfurtransferase
MSRSCAIALALVLTLPVAGREIETVTPERAYEMVQEPGTYLVDVRSVAEYVLVGHPEMAYNVPITFWNEGEAGFVPNPDFLRDLTARFRKEADIIFICRSGKRSLKAAQLALEAGYAGIYHIAEGFEGELDEKGCRTVGGWKNRLPFTYRLDPKLSFRKAAGVPNEDRN